MIITTTKRISVRQNFNRLVGEMGEKMGFEIAFDRRKGCIMSNNDSNLVRYIPDLKLEHNFLSIQVPRVYVYDLQLQGHALHKMLLSS